MCHIRYKRCSFCPPLFYRVTEPEAALSASDRNLPSLLLRGFSQQVFFAAARGRLGPRISQAIRILSSNSPACISASFSAAFEAESTYGLTGNREAAARSAPCFVGLNYLIYGWSVSPSP